jgi:hypothetical protein
METLADLSLDPDDIDSAKKRVASLARKMLPPDAFPNVGYRTLCISDLLGGHIEMGRKAVLAGGTTTESSDGRVGVSFNVSPENEALLRWRNGEFNEDDLELANTWRKNSQSINLEQMKQSLPRTETKITTLDDLERIVDAILEAPDAQEDLLRWFIDFLRCETCVKLSVLHRWRLRRCNSVQDFAPYAFHCLRVNAMFYIGMSHGLLGTKPTNVVDVEYLYYTPFAQIFCSGDKLHKRLAPLVIAKDQSFVDRDALASALIGVADARKRDTYAEPDEDSLIVRLWRQHVGTFAPQASPTPISDERAAEIDEELKPIMEAIRRSAAEEKTAPRWPR